MRVAIYSRVSTRDGEQDIENQRHQLRRFCETQGWEIVREYEDQDSGGKSDRTQFRQEQSLDRALYTDLWKYPF